MLSSRRNRITTTLAACAMALLIASTALAWRLDYTLEKAAPEVSGRGAVELEQVPFTTREWFVRVRVFGLRPGSVYSVWSVDGDERHPVGLTGRNHFRTDGSGTGTYVAHTDEDTIGMKTLAIALHPGGDPADTGSMVVKLKTLLYP